MENLASTLQIVSYICFALAVLLALLAIALFIRQNLRSVFRDLSGKTLETAIEDIRSGNASAVKNKRSRIIKGADTFSGTSPHYVTAADGETDSSNGTTGGFKRKKAKPQHQGLGKNEETELLEEPTGNEVTEQLISPTELLEDEPAIPNAAEHGAQSDATGEETCILPSDETTFLDEDATQIIAEDEDVTNAVTETFQITVKDIVVHTSQSISFM